jgi:hypothetical protein
MADDTMVRVVCHLGVGGQPSSSDEPYASAYAQATLAGEFVRNVCVNLGLDPDTHGGVTRNAAVHLRDAQTGGWQAWAYHPGRSLASHGFQGDVEILVHETLTGRSESSPTPSAASGEGAGWRSHGNVARRSKRDHGDVAPFAADEDRAIAASLDCTALDDDAELVVPPT